MSRSAAWVLPALACLSACTVGPDYHRPDIATPAAFVGAGAASRSPADAAEDAARVAAADAAPDMTPDPTAAAGATAAAAAQLALWWQQFDDPVLSGLIARALAGNPSLEVAISRIREARFAEIETGAAQYPSISAMGSAVKLHANGGSGGSGVAIPSRFTSYSAGFDASWEVDLFGATRRAVEQASANTEAAIWARRDGEVSLSAEVAADYLALRGLQARIRTGNDELARQQDQFVLISARRAAGFVTELDVNEQSTLVATAAAQLPELTAEAHAHIHALGVLLGEAPEALDAELDVAGGALPRPPASLLLVLPAQLIQRRPDVRRAERVLAASSAGIGIKQAGLYPKLNLYALTAFAGTAMSDLFSLRNLLVAGLGTASEPVFDGGRDRAALGQAQEQHTQSALAYRMAILDALRDVEDALSRHRAEDARRVALVRAVDAAQASLRIAEDQYRTGFVTFANVLHAQYVLLGAQDQLSQSEVQVMLDVVAVYKALGGGWTK